MKNYRIADLSVNLEVNNRSLRQAEKYKVSDLPDEHADITVSDLEPAVFKIMENNPHATYEMVEYLLSGTRFYKALVNYDGFMLHSSAVVLDGKAYLFSADSGVGKSTHTSLWLKRFENAFILNDDKPALRIMGSKVMVYGTPWNGKGENNVNTCAELGGIAFIYRNDENIIERMSTTAALRRLLQQTAHRKFNPEVMDKLLNIWDTMLQKYPVYSFGLRPDLESVDLAYRTMRGENQ